MLIDPFAISQSDFARARARVVPADWKRPRTKPTPSIRIDREVYNLIDREVSPRIDRTDFESALRGHHYDCVFYYARVRAVEAFEYALYCAAWNEVAFEGQEQLDRLSKRVGGIKDFVQECEGTVLKTSSELSSTGRHEEQRVFLAEWGAQNSRLTETAEDLRRMFDAQRDRLSSIKNFENPKVAFVAEVGFTWRKLTGRDPSNSTPFNDFVDGNYQSFFEDAIRHQDWEQPVKMASAHFRPGRN